MAVPNTEGGGRRGDQGFTLVEMMVALIVIGVLVAIAIPTFLSARERASDRSAQSKVTTALKAHKAHVASKAVAGYYSGPDEARIELEAMEPSLDFPNPALPEVRGAVYVKDAGGNVVTLVTRASTSGRCFWSRETAGVISYATTSCDAASTASPPPPASPLWTTKHW